LANYLFPSLPLSLSLSLHLSSDDARTYLSVRKIDSSRAQHTKLNLWQFLSLNLGLSSFRFSSARFVSVGGPPAPLHLHPHTTSLRHGASLSAYIGKKEASLLPPIDRASEGAPSQLGPRALPPPSSLLCKHSPHSLWT